MFFTLPLFFISNFNRNSDCLNVLHIKAIIINVVWLPAKIGAFGIWKSFPPPQKASFHVSEETEHYSRDFENLGEKQTVSNFSTYIMRELQISVTQV